MAQYPKFTKLLRQLFFTFFIAGGLALLITEQFWAADNPIVLENQNPGSTGWQIDFDNGALAEDINNQIRGYGSTTSINKGQSINFHITANPAQAYRIEVYRMGWYGGAGGRLMQTIPNLAGTPQPACPQNAQTGMVECQWAVGYTLNIPANWTTGVYLAKLINSQNYQSYIMFVVRDDSRAADFLYQQPVTTYQAYNSYPDNRTTGKSLYDNLSYGQPTGLGTQRAVKVSFDRPYGGVGGYDGSGQFLDPLFWEQYLIRWLEREGYDISYSTDIDTHINAGRLRAFKGILSAGHDEYWSKEMFDAFAGARDAGVNLAFWGANPAYFQIRLEPSSQGRANRVVVCYKNANLDPTTNPSLETVTWREAGRPEQTLVGIQYITFGDLEATEPYFITNSSHWVWQNTGFSNGSVAPGITGYEIDRFFSEFPGPANISYTKLASSPFQGEIAESSIYQAPSGAWVFAAGTMSWSWALDRQGYVNAGIQQATRNILNRFRGSTTPPTSTPTPSPTPTSTPPPTNNSLTVQVNQSQDDVEEALFSGIVYRTSDDLELGYDRGLHNGAQMVGIRFRNVQIPAGATILRAYLEFTVAEVDFSTNASFDFWGRSSSNAPAFGTSRFSVSSLPRTRARVSWFNVQRWSNVGSTRQSPDLSPIVQEIVNFSNWGSGNALAFLIRGSGRRVAYAYDGWPAAAPRLFVEWRNGSQTGRSLLSEESVVTDPAITAPVLQLDYATGGPGSQFALLGDGFAPNTSTAILINGNPVATVTTDETGAFGYTVVTAATDSGNFQVTTDQQPAVAVTFAVDNAEPVRTAPAAEEVVEEEASGEETTEEEQAHQLYLPMMRR